MRQTFVTILLILLCGSAIAAQAPDRIFYNAYRFNSTDIYVSRDGGQTIAAFTDDPGLDYGPSITPDGRWIIFTSERTGKPNLFIKPSDGSSPERQLLKSDSMQDQAVVSPDGKWIAFVSTHMGDAEIFIAAFDPSGEIDLVAARNLTNHPGGDFRPAFSPDGSFIAFSSDRGHPIKEHPQFPFARRRTGDIWLMNSSGGDLKRLTDSVGWDGSPEWAPDGKAIYFYSNRTGHERVFKMAADGSGQEPISPEGVNAASPQLLPGGNILFFSWTEAMDGSMEIGPKQLDPATGRIDDWLRREIHLIGPETHPNGLIAFYGGPIPERGNNKGGIRGDVLLKNSPLQTNIEGLPVGLYGVRRAFVASPDPAKPVLYFSANAVDGMPFTNWLFALAAFPVLMAVLALAGVVFMFWDRRSVAFWKYIVYVIGVLAILVSVVGAFFLVAVNSPGPIVRVAAVMGVLGLLLLLSAFFFFRQGRTRSSTGDPRSRLSRLSALATGLGAAAALYIAIFTPFFMNTDAEFFAYNYREDRLEKLFDFGVDHWTHPAFASVLDTRMMADGRSLTFTTGLFFGSEPDKGSIWSYNLESRRLERPVSSGMNDGFGDFTTDGKKTVFRSSRSGHFDIYLSENEEVRNLTNDVHKDNFPTISADGTKIAFSSDREGAPYASRKAMDIFLIELLPDGNWTPPRKLTTSKGQNAHAHFSPDGNWVIYTTEDFGIADEEPLVQSTGFHPQLYGEIVALRLSDGKRIRLTHNKWEDGTPLWVKGY